MTHRRDYYISSAGTVCLAAKNGTGKHHTQYASNHHDETDAEIWKVPGDAASPHSVIDPDSRPGHADAKGPCALASVTWTLTGAVPAVARGTLDSRGWFPFETPARPDEFYCWTRSRRTTFAFEGK